ncbi:hypothetical protein CMI47_04675 [Candidatus Pacearchaeota archaeon]|jgi:hypothetical protein|nr:hypothetical protein [Candidatus Pacearchaeota archaeon]|tara:strand:+ start:16287 stop:16526 length:240 start_codon:yes stop_codon:yes gene_type:complete
MEYNVRIVPFNNVPMGLDGDMQPLCNSCMSGDCTNPIAKTCVSVFGEERYYRLYKTGSSYKMVIDCDGYMKFDEKYEED